MIFNEQKIKWNLTIEKLNIIHKIIKFITNVHMNEPVQFGTLKPKLADRHPEA